MAKLNISTEDPHDLGRFVEAQAGVYTQALAEVLAGSKQSHWMWFVFPQLAGLGSSPTARRYAIKNLAEARAYLAHPVLGPRLVEIAEAAVGIVRKSVSDVFGYPDDLKLKSCATLFAAISPPGSVFERLLERFFEGRRDEQTVVLLNDDTTGGQSRS